MTYCYPVWTAAPRAAVHHITRGITHHAIRHAALATVRTVCVAAPVWLATPSPAAAPPVPVAYVMPPVVLPWPGDDVGGGGWGDEAPIGLGGDEGGVFGGGYGGGSGGGGGGTEQRHAPLLQPALSTVSGGDIQTSGGGDIATFTSSAVSAPDVPRQAVPEPWSVAVLGFGLVVLGWVRLPAFRKRSDMVP